ncbi:MAG: DUF1015 domain-containing protein [Clostridia bacterium]|nr:DUF1015 domain-containing protein [Clostridia bacterium]
MNTKNIPFIPANVLLPKEGFEHWSVIACDQFTSRPEYWEGIKREIGDSPSALELIFPEVYLGKGDDDAVIRRINSKMREYLDSDIFTEYKDSFIYVRRTQRDSRVRCGLVGAVDLCAYDFHPDAKCEIRATERTVMERLPPRVRIREQAPIELPHVMMLIDDPSKTVIEPLEAIATAENLLYDFELMEGGGHLCGYLVPKSLHDNISERIAALRTHEEQILFAVGDGNHSLASAKLCHEQAPTEINRYALVELVNLHSDALDFEPILRVVENVDPEGFISGFEAYLTDQGATLVCDNEIGDDIQHFTMVYGENEKTVAVRNAPHALAVGTVQEYIDKCIALNHEINTDYIHGEDEVRDLAKRPACVGILYDSITKQNLFASVEEAGVLPRKTFSMGHAHDKRYYTEARRIK